jgi:molecular chaperone GrpE
VSELEYNENGESPAENPGTQSAETSIAEELASQLRTVLAERDRLEAEKAELQELLLRRQADHENFRRRAERERAEVFEVATMDAAGALLPVLDDFERALKAIPEDTADDYIRGMRLIYQRFSDALKKLGLDPIQAEGKPFDPNLHHAVQKEERDDLPDHTVIDELQRGYYFKGRLLRAAMVRVAVSPS